jgi:hypothetical protein
MAGRLTNGALLGITRRWIVYCVDTTALVSEAGNGGNDSISTTGRDRYSAAEGRFGMTAINARYPRRGRSRWSSAAGETHAKYSGRQPAREFPRKPGRDFILSL